MIVLGIDPGTQACGWGLVQLSAGKLVHLGHGVVRLSGELHTRLDALYLALTEIIEGETPAVVAVEGVFSHKNARSALVLGHARGVALLCAARAGLGVAEYPPATVKKTVVGSGRAEKSQVGMMVSTLLGIDAPRAADAADALAVAICHAHHCGRLPAAKTPKRARAALEEMARPSVIRNRR